MIKVNHLKKRYGKEIVLKDLSFEVRKGDIFSLLGPNGAGKTTTLECMEGLRNFDGGEILIDGLRPKEALKKGLTGVQLQSSSLPAAITVKDAMKLFCTWKKIEYRGDLMEGLGLEELSNKKYKTLSTGQKRRLHLALALSHSPEVLFLDEPTAGLDVEARANLHKEIRRLKEEGTTIVLASHDMAEVEALSDQVGMIVKGELRQLGSPGEIVGNIEKEEWLEVCWRGTIEDFPEEFLFQWEKNKEAYRCRTFDKINGIREILDFTESRSYELLDLKIVKPSLEERFLELSKGGI